MDTDKRGPGRPPSRLYEPVVNQADLAKALADIDTLRSRIEALEQIIMAPQSAIDKPRPSESWSAWNNRLNAGTN